MTDMTLRFWGTRGSIPTPGRLTEKFGGNTTCLELRYGNEIVVFDAGSGFREMGMSWMDEFAGRPIKANIVFTHLHWDHIQGFPFFGCGYVPSNSFTIYGETRPSGTLKDLLSGQMTGDYFPIPLSAMQAALEFRTIDGPFQIGELQITPFKLPHPGGSLGFRVEAGGRIFVLATDSELDSIALNKDEVKADHSVSRRYSDEVLEFFRGANLIVIDCQYTDEVYKTRVGWGHNSIGTVVDLCEQVRPDMLALFHHDPQSTDATVTRMADDTARRLHRKNTGILAFAAREGLTVKVGKPKPPPALT